MAFPFQAAHESTHVPAGYRVNDDGVFKEEEKGRFRRLTTVAMCVKALTRNLTATDWSIEAAWTDSDGNDKTAILAYNALHKRRGEALEDLASDGLFIIPGMTAEIARFIALSAALPTMPRVLIHRQLGFFRMDRPGTAGDLAFMLPNACLVPVALDQGDAATLEATTIEDIRFHPHMDSGTYELYAAAGNLEQWQDGIRPVAGNMLLVFSVSMALAAPFQTLANIDTFIVHMFGNSSTGKTAALQAAVSVWGDAGDPQKAGSTATLIERWNTTGNAIEATAASHSGIFLGVDELGASGEALTSVYNITAGSGKARMTETGGLRSQHRWSLCILSTGEGSMQDKIETTTKRKINTGELIRALDIPVAELALNGDLSQEESARLIDELKAHCTVCHGTAGAAFVQAVLDHFQTEAALRQWLEEIIDHLHTEFVREARESGRNIGQAHARALRRFAFIAAVASMASQFGILPFTEEVVVQSVSAVVEAWLQALPALAEGERAVEAIRDYVIRNRAKILHYESWQQGSCLPSQIPTDMRAIQKRGLLLFTPVQFEQACGGMPVGTALRELRNKEVLQREGQKLTLRVDIAELDFKRTPFYAINVKRLLSGSDFSLVQGGIAEAQDHTQETEAEGAETGPQATATTRRAERDSGPRKIWPKQMDSNHRAARF